MSTGALLASREGGDSLNEDDGVDRTAPRADLDEEVELARVEDSEEASLQARKSGTLDL